jgi:hypothetical protein
MKKTRIEPCWFGERKIVYVRVLRPDHDGRGHTRNFVVYGKTVDQVAVEVSRGLAKSFGYHGGGHVRRGRPPGRKNKSVKR